MCNGVRLSKESRTKMRRGGYSCSLIERCTIHEITKIQNNKRNAKTYTAYLVTTNTETGTTTHKTHSET